MADLALVERLAAADRHLAVITTCRADGSVHASVVSAGVTRDPVDGSPSVGLVAHGDSVKLKLLRRTGRATVVFKDGYQWAAVAGPTRLVGPDDGAELGLDVPDVIRSVYRAAGGDHEDWDEFDRVMAEDRRCAVFVRAERISANPTA
ncbi:MAG TPA: pyridoxamine 5'-phosphate oxidase family protein [Acidimicrobiales bacterium]|nr:pyridoxamine 5'-phosphate oxidase family protein [Acidimicrobiales bacterium]